MKIKTNIVHTRFFLAVFLLLYAYFAREWAYDVDNMFGKTFLQLTRHLIHIGLILAWIASVNQRILQKSIRYYLLAAGGLLAFWLYIRTVKWMFFPAYSWQERYLWYAYYIPLILIPLLGVFLVQHLGREESCTLSGNWKFLYIPALFLIGLVFTNDLHQVVFRFPVGKTFSSSEYFYGIGYFFIAAWCLGLTIYFIVMLLFKCQAPGKRWFQKLPFLVLLAAVLFSILYCLHIVKADLTAVDCLIIIALLESCTQSGLIRSNSGYGSLFEAAHFEAQILDKKGNICYISRQANELDQASRELMQNPGNAGLIWKNRRLNCASITGGKVLWWENVEKVLEYTHELEETNARILEQNDLLKAELDLREKQLRIDEQNRLYDQITRDVAEQLRQLEQLLKNEENISKEQLAQICVLSAYIKRRSNLCLLAEKDSSLCSKELELCILESLENIRLCGVACSLDSHCTGKASARNLILLYDGVQQIFQQILPYAGAVLVRFDADGEKLSLRIQTDSRISRDFPVKKLWEAAGGSVVFHTAGDDVRVEFCMEGGCR